MSTGRVSPDTPWPDRAQAFARTMWHEIVEDRLLGLSAETAFFAVLSLFPALLIATGLLGLLDVLVGADLAARIQDQVTTALDLVLTDEASATIESVQELFERDQGGLLTFASIGALVTLSGAFAVVIDALNHAYDTQERRTWVRRRAMGLVLGLATVALLVVSLTVVVVGPLLGRGEDVADVVGLGSAFVVVWDVLRLPVLFLVTTAWLTALYRYAPSRRTPWRACVPGALSTTVLWLVASGGFHLYLEVVSGRNPVIGAFGGGVIVMTWVYLLSLALLLGGELNATLLDHRHLLRPRPEKPETEGSGHPY